MATADTLRPTRKLWWVTILAGMASFLDSAAIVSTGTALVLFQDDFGLTADDIGVLSALLTIMIALGAIVGGRLGDALGRKRVFTVTILLYAIGALLLTITAAPAMIWIGVILLGFASGADLPVSLAMIAESSPEDQRGKMISFTQALWVAGVLAITLLGVVVGGMGSMGARIMYGVLLVVAVLLLVLRRGLPESTAWQKTHEAASVDASRTTTETSGLLRLLGSRYVVPLLAVGLFFGIFNIGANTSGQFTTFLYVNVAGSSVQLSSAISFASNLFGVLVLWVVMRIVDTRWRMVGFLVGSICGIVAFLLPAVFGVSVPTLVILAFLWAIAGNMAGEPMFKVWSQELFPTRYRATAQGVMVAFVRLVAAAVAIVTPGLAEGSPKVLFLFIVGCLVVAALIGLLWVPRLRRVASEELPVDAHPEESR